jgi:hypothetical protein
MKVEDVMWWNYPPKALNLARNMKDGRYSWHEIANYLYRVGFPFFEPDMLRMAVLAADRSGWQPGDHPVKRRRPDPELPPPKPQPKQPDPAPPAPDLEQLADSYRAAWEERFPGKPWPGDAVGIRTLMREQRRGPASR